MVEVQPASVYLLYDTEDRLLYIGMTSKAFRRFDGHQLTKPWWRDVVRAEFKHFGTERQARIAEALLIRDLNPRYNRARPLNDCIICGVKRAKTRQRCGTCYNFWYCNGRDFTPDELAGLSEHRQERAAAAQLRKNGIVMLDSRYGIP